MRYGHEGLYPTPLQSQVASLLVQHGTAIGVALPLPFLGVSSLNFGPLFRAAFFSAFSVPRAAASRTREGCASLGRDAARRQLILDFLHDMLEHGHEAVAKLGKATLPGERPLIHVDPAVDLDLEGMASE
jgi:hypothetical protein